MNLENSNIINVTVSTQGVQGTSGPIGPSGLTGPQGPLNSGYLDSILFISGQLNSLLGVDLLIL